MRKVKKKIKTSCMRRESRLRSRKTRNDGKVEKICGNRKNFEDCGRVMNVNGREKGEPGMRMRKEEVERDNHSVVYATRGAPDQQQAG